MGDYYEENHRGNWWRRRGDQPLLYWRRVVTLRTAIGKSPRLPVLVDVGSGEGHFARRASKSGFHVVATEYTSAGVRRTSEAVGTGTVVRSDGTAMPFRSGSIDAITLWDVVEHVDRSQRLFDEAARVLRSGGVLALSTPNPNARSVIKRGRNSTQFLDPTHINIQSEAEWRRQVEAAGLRVLMSGGDSWWDPPYGDRVPSVVYKLLTQMMFLVRPAWPISTGENTVLFAYRA